MSDERKIWSIVDIRVVCVFDVYDEIYTDLHRTMGDRDRIVA